MRSLDMPRATQRFFSVGTDIPTTPRSRSETY